MGQDDGHLEQGPQGGAHRVRADPGEGLRAVPALKDQGLAPCDRCQTAGQQIALGRKEERG